MWGEVRQGGPASSVPSIERSVQAVRSLGTTRNLGTTTLCHSGGLWDRTLCPTTHMDCCVCVYNNLHCRILQMCPSDLTGSVFCHVRSPLAPWEEEHMWQQGSCPSCSTVCAPGKVGPLCTAQHCDVTRWRGLCRGPASVSSRALASPHSLLFVIFIICAVIMLENGCFFLNKRKVAARISRIKAWLAGNQCRVLKTGRAAEPSTVVPIPGEQCFGSPKERLLLGTETDLPFLLPWQAAMENPTQTPAWTA